MIHLLFVLFLISSIHATTPNATTTDPTSASNGNFSIISTSTARSPNITSPDEEIERKLIVVPESEPSSAEETSSEAPQDDVMSEVKIGKTKCASNEICTHIDSSHCKEGVCECLETHVPDLNATACLKIAIDAQDSCQIDMQCKEPTSKCVNNKCSKHELIKSATSAVLSTVDVKEDYSTGTASAVQISLLSATITSIFFITF